MSNSGNIIKKTGIGLSLFLSVAFISAFIYQKKTVEKALINVDRLKEFSQYSHNLFETVKESEYAARAYLLTDVPYYLESYIANKKVTANYFTQVHLPLSDSQNFIKSSIIFKNIVQKRITFLDSAIKLKKQELKIPFNNKILLSSSILYLNQINELKVESEKTENKLLQNSLSTSKKENNKANIISVAGVLCMLFLIILLLKKYRKIAENEEKRKEDSIFQGLLEAAPDAMVIINENRKIVLINQQTQNMFGYTKEDLIDETVEKLVLENFSHNNKRYKDYSSKHIPSWLITGEHELVAVKKNGIKFPVEINLSPFQTDKGLLVFASVRDISERKKTAESLKTVEQKFELLVNSLKEYAMFLIDKNGYVASWNSGAEHIKGYNAKEIIGKPISIFYSEEDQLNDMPKNDLSKALKDGHIETQGWRVRKDGTTFFANIVITTLHDDEGKLSGYAMVTKDITLNFKAEERIRFLATITNNIQDPIVSTDSNFFITSWSTGAEKLFGWKPEETIGKTVAALLLVEYPTHNREQIIKQLNTHEFWQGEVIYQTKSGTPINALATVSILKDANGVVGGNLLLIRDITKQKIAENALQNLNSALEERVKERTEEVYKNEKKYRALIENNYDVICLLDESFNIIYRSPSAFRVTGYGKTELDTIFSIKNLHPDDVAAAQLKIEQVLENPFKTFSILFRNRHKNGHFLWIEGSMTNLLKDENVAAIVFNYRDVTERVEGEEKLINSEKLYRNLFENMLNGFAYCHAIFINGTLQDYTYLSVNKEYELLMGLKDITSKKISVLIPGLLLSDTLYAATISSVLLTGKPGKIDTFYKPLNRWLSISIYSPGENYFVCLIDNITTRKETEEHIYKINEELEEKVAYRTLQLKKTNDELEAFSYSVSHDLRAPLRGIIGFASILEEDYINKLDAEAKRLITIIKTNTVKMGRLIDDLLRFSRLNKHQLIKTSINLNVLVEELVTSYRTEENKNIQWIIASLPAIKGDAATIQQVWINLISNAIKYSRKMEQPVIEIGWKQNGKEEVFFVKDNGVGFDLKYKDKLFKVFQRLHSESEFEGTGVGLAIVEKIVTKHGGSIWADSAVGHGASFYFTIPR